jgi:hypothetical protein
MLKKNKAVKGPTWFEIGFAAFLSAVLGVVLGAAYLVSKPVTKADAVPKDAPAGRLFYIEGKRDVNKTTSALEKRKRFASGESVSLTEGEINVLFQPTGKSADEPKKPAAKGAPPPPPPEVKMLDIGSVNTRISDGEVQFGDSVTYNVYGFTGVIFVHTRGSFARRGAQFVFVPAVTYVGGCPVDRIPFAREWVFRNLLFTAPFPDDVSAAWQKLVGVSVSGSSLELNMP